MSSLTVQLFAWKCLFSLLPLIENDVLCYSVPLLKMIILFKYNCTCRLDFLCSDMFKFQGLQILLMSGVGVTSALQILESFCNIWSQVSQRKKPFSDFPARGPGMYTLS